MRDSLSKRVGGSGRSSSEGFDESAGLLRHDRFDERLTTPQRPAFSERHSLNQLPPRTATEWSPHGCRIAARRPIPPFSRGVHRLLYRDDSDRSAGVFLGISARSCDAPRFWHANRARIVACPVVRRSFPNPADRRGAPDAPNVEAAALVHRGLFCRALLVAPAQSAALLRPGGPLEISRCASATGQPPFVVTRPGRGGGTRGTARATRSCKCRMPSIVHRPRPSRFPSPLQGERRLLIFRWLTRTG